ncbi:S9 family peptidase [Brevundimonas kwangchunensis]|uniref:S9 family peptidase n=1 Tax=Brevundimonas kwangchunensis TaxID=322163 RepID=A0ABP3RMT7_9CAUL
MLGGCLLGGLVMAGGASGATRSVAPYRLEDFFGRNRTRAVSLSPNGARIAVLDQLGTEEQPQGVIDIIRAEDPEGSRQRIELGAVVAEAMRWGSDDRLLVRVAVTQAARAQMATGSNRRSRTAELTARRVISIHVGTGEAVILFNDQRERMRHSVDMGRVVDMLPNDPDHVLMTAWEREGVLGLHRVNIATGAAERIERGSGLTIGWQTQGGAAVMRHDLNSRGTMETVYGRAPGETDWKMVRQTRVVDTPDFAWVAETDRPGVVLVRARTAGDDFEAVRELDLRTLAMGQPINARSGRDVSYGLNDSAGNFLGAAYYAEHLEYEFAEPALTPHHAALRQFFENECDVHLTEVSRDRNRFIAYVTGPREPGAWYFYDRAARAIVGVGARRTYDAERLGSNETLSVTTRDGAVIEAYLTAPPGGAPGPLVVLPHGGPEMRDTQAWDHQVQVFAAQGWWVLRPNFRGSGGYGLDFARQGWTRWGDRMQEDVEDAVVHVVNAKGLPADKVAIVGTSYGGYAALMGAAKRPDLYRAAIGICGVYDLPDMLAWEEREDELPGKPTYEFWTRRIGDPRTMGPALATASPRRRVQDLTCPILLVHGVTDTVVPVIQSRRMHEALRAAGKASELIEIEGFGHGDWPAGQERELMERYVTLLGRAFA